MRQHLATKGQGITGNTGLSYLVPWTCYKCNTTSKVNILDKNAECPWCGNTVQRFKNNKIDSRISMNGGKRLSRSEPSWDEYNKTREVK